ncbi:MAG TPA: SUMF1/EgtB/PvdO family nonheme iron enzyme [Opitutaceae bacterium]|nr:SUMF1/EgtB/PvdO family nonheme iron enzyme [Opitutaceae bacterium]
MDDLDLGATVRGFVPGQKVFNRYTLLRQLGRGGMGVVWRARDESLEQDVAIKMLPEIVANDPVSIRELKRETSRNQQLSHPHILRVFDLVEAGSLCGITMEVAEGGTVSQRRLDQPHEHFEVADLREWVRQLCEALDHAHRRAKIVHRDLKPANLMLTAGDELKVTDFGIAASLSESMTRVSKQAGSSGTPLYMSPQQMMGEKPAVTDDIYALGATLFELLTGKPPFYSGNVVLQVQSKTPPSMDQRRRDLEVAGEAIPAEWEAAVAACLQKDPAARPQSAREVSERLGFVPGAAPKASAPQSARSNSSPSASAAAAESRGEPAIGGPSRARFLAGVGLGLVLATAAAIWFGIVMPERAQAREREARVREAEAKRLQAAADSDRSARDNLLTSIRLLADNSSALDRSAYGRRVAEYVEARRLGHTEVQQAWDSRLASWEAADRLARERAAAEEEKRRAAQKAEREKREPEQMAKPAELGPELRERARDFAVAALSYNLATDASASRLTLLLKYPAEVVREAAKFAALADQDGKRRAMAEALVRESERLQQFDQTLFGDQATADFIHVGRRALGAALVRLNLDGVAVPPTLASEGTRFARLDEQAQAIEHADWLKRMDESLRSAKEVRVPDRGQSGEPSASSRAELAAGFEVQPLTDALRAEHGLEAGVVGLLVVGAEGDAQRGGLRVGAVITEINRLPVSNIEAGKAALKAGRNLLLCLHQGRLSYLVVEVSNGVGTAKAFHGPQVGASWEIPDLGIGFQPIAAGTFTMGESHGPASRRESRPTTVTISRPFWMGTTEVTQAQWKAMMGNSPSEFSGDQLPVDSVTWPDAMEFCRKLTVREQAAGRLPEGYVYALPTEAQWEYACRAGTTGTFAGDIDAMGWTADTSRQRTHPVGQKVANAWGLHDMHGNVWEWCADWYAPLPGGSVRDPAGPSSGAKRIARGGCYFNSISSSSSGNRYYHAPTETWDGIGFRVALAPSTP